jgi:acyl-CoA dehydrogenase
MLTGPLFHDTFTPEHLAFRDMVLRFAREQIAPHAFDWEEAESFPPALYRAAGAAGILGPTVPLSLGGGGGDVLHLVVAGEALLRGGSTGVAVGLGSLEIALPPILALGTEAQRQRFIPSVVSGEHIAALAITEPGTGSDVAGVRTRAERDGGHYVLTGTKTFITSGVRADRVVVLARTGPDPHHGLTFFVVERGMPGFTVSKALKKTGWRASDTAELCFDGVRVPLDHRIGPEGSGFIALMQNFANERLMLAVNGCALAQIALEEARRYATEREAFGRQIGKFQVIRHQLAEMSTAVASAWALTLRVASRMRDGLPMITEVAIAKNHAATVARDVTWQAVQIHGGMGYMRETLVERLSRDARLLPIGGGTHQIMNELIARSL